MEHDEYSRQVLHALCKTGDIEGVRTFLERTLPVLPPEYQISFCDHFAADPLQCHDTPCTALVTHLSEAAAREGQTDMFAYLWDFFLAPRGISSIPWQCLKVSASKGFIDLAQAFWLRDPDCFNAIEPPSAHPIGATRSRQIKIAIRSDRFNYIDFMLAHGVEINTNDDILHMVVRCAVEDAITLKRIHFLVSRGLTVNDSMALQEIAAGGNVDIAKCLIDYGADADGALAVAASKGHLKIVELLNGHASKTELLEAVNIARKNGHEDVVGFLKYHQRVGEVSKGSIET